MLQYDNTNTREISGKRMLTFCANYNVILKGWPQHISGTVNCTEGVGGCM